MMKTDIYVKQDRFTTCQPVSRLVEQVHYFGGWVEGAKSLCAKTMQADRSGGGRCSVFKHIHGYNT